MLELDAGVGCGEAPVDGDLLGVAFLLPSVDLASEGLFIGDASVGALGTEDAELALGASDGQHAAELVEVVKSNTGCEVEQVIGDTAYGGMETRAELGDREVIAPTVKPHSKRSIGARSLLAARR